MVRTPREAIRPLLEGGPYSPLWNTLNTKKKVRTPLRRNVLDARMHCVQAPNHDGPYASITMQSGNAEASLYRRANIFQPVTCLHANHLNKILFEPTCPSRESNPGRWMYTQTLYHVVVKADFHKILYLSCTKQNNPGSPESVCSLLIAQHREQLRRVLPYIRSLMTLKNGTLLCMKVTGFLLRVFRYDASGNWLTAGDLPPI